MTDRIIVAKVVNGFIVEPAPLLGDHSYREVGETYVFNKIEDLFDWISDQFAADPEDYVQSD